MDGSVTSWPSVANNSASLGGLIKVSKVYATDSAFAAFREDGSFYLWGDAAAGNFFDANTPKP